MPMSIGHQEQVEEGDEENGHSQIEPYFKQEGTFSPRTRVVESIPTDELLQTERKVEERDPYYQSEIVVSPIPNESPIRSPCTGDKSENSPSGFTRLSEIKRRLQAQKEIELSSLQSSSDGQNTMLRKSGVEMNNYTIPERESELVSTVNVLSPRTNEDEIRVDSSVMGQTPIPQVFSPMVSTGK